MLHLDDDKKQVKKPELTAEQIAKLNALVGDVDDDQAEGKGDLTEDDVSDLKGILGID